MNLIHHMGMRNIHLNNTDYTTSQQKLPRPTMVGNKVTFLLCQHFIYILNK